MLSLLTVKLYSHSLHVPITTDLPAMEAITNIVCDYNEDYTSFTLSFFFAENPYFTNEVCAIGSTGLQLILVDLMVLTFFVQ